MDVLNEPLLFIRYYHSTVKEVRLGRPVFCELTGSEIAAL